MKNEAFSSPRHISRRTAIKGLTVAALALSGYGCAPSSSQPSVSPTPTVRPLGSVMYTYQGHTDRVTSIGWSPDGGRIVSGSLDKTVQVWGATTGSHAIIFRGHTGGVMTVAWSPYSKLVVSGSLDTTVRVWNITTGNASNIYHGHTAQINAVAWSPDEKYIASGSTDKTVQIWEATTGKLLYTYRGHTNKVTAVAWSPDGKYIASGSLDKTVQVWEATTGTLLYTYSGYNVEAAKANPSKGVLPDLIFEVAWSHNGKHIAAVTQVYCGDICAEVLFWDATTGRNVSFYPDFPVFALAWSPDDTRIVSAVAH